jgi:large subunit ribosomal protein L22
VATTTEQPTLVRAQIRHLRCSARKARIVLDDVRGMPVAKAHAVLQFSPRSAARDVLGLLESATANARENHEIDRAELVIQQCYADEDRTLKRFKPRARGRASSIHKRMCHVTIVLRHVPVAATRDLSAAEATIAAERGRRTRARRTPRTAAQPSTVESSVVEDAAVEEPAVEETAPKRKPAARKPKAEAPEAAAPKARKPRAAKPAETAQPKAAAPKAPRKKPGAKPAEPASPPADDADETAADEGDS